MRLTKPIFKLGNKLQTLSFAARFTKTRSGSSAGR